MKVICEKAKISTCGFCSFFLTNNGHTYKLFKIQWWFGDLGRMAISFQGAGSSASNYFRGSGEQDHSFGILGSHAKK